jgi:hypothetical protein
MDIQKEDNEETQTIFKPRREAGNRVPAQSSEGNNPASTGFIRLTLDSDILCLSHSL